MDDDHSTLDELDADYLARKYWLPVDQVKRVIDQSGSRSNREIEEALALLRRGRYG